MDAAGAVVATDWASTSTPESRLRPRARSGDIAGRSSSSAENDRVMASDSADIVPSEVISPLIVTKIRAEMLR
ncbi:hypothetical protein GCM10009608_55000 [Pseudonocardia alaniniphila]